MCTKGAYPASAAGSSAPFIVSYTLKKMAAVHCVCVFWEGV